MRQPSNFGKKTESFFGEIGFKAALQKAKDEVKNIYRSDDIPWVIGYSGGKDSTAVLQLTILALEELPSEERHKKVYVISTDTLVENPIVAAWVNKSHDRLRQYADEKDIALEPRRLTPDLRDSYWVNLIGRGYPAPRPKFRWCTERMKINPVSAFVSDVVQAHGEAIIVLGTRKSESAARARVMNRMAEGAIRDRLRPHSDLPNSFVYSPIDSWTNDDVWMFLMQVKNPWGHNNEDLLTMYRGASADGECPLVVDSSTPSCGDSRFGCWVCTLVDKDRSMSAMIQNDQEKDWMLPLLRLRDQLIPRDSKGHPQDRHLRDFRRMGGGITLMKNGEPVPGPYIQSVREKWLRELLRAQRYVRKAAPEGMRDLELISFEELREIRRIWVNDKHEIEDNLPKIFEEALGEPFPDDLFAEDLPLGNAEVLLLRQECGDDELHFELTRQLLSIERQHKGLARRAGLFDDLEGAFRRSYFNDADDAVGRAQEMKNRIDDAIDEIDPEPYLDQTSEPLLPGLAAKE